MDNMFTPSAKHVLLIAHEQAKYFKHQAVGTEHLLLALAMDKDGIANKIFEQFSITSDDIREEIERLIGYGTLDQLGPADYLPYSPKAKQVLALAGQEAAAAGSSGKPASSPEQPSGKQPQEWYTDP